MRALAAAPWVKLPKWTTSRPSGVFIRKVVRCADSIGRNQGLRALGGVVRRSLEVVKLAAPGRMFWPQALCILCLATAGFSAERLPPPPERYFNQYTNVVSRDVAEALNQKLEAFERESSTQILVVIYPGLPPNAALEDFTVRAAQA